MTIRDTVAEAMTHIASIHDADDGVYATTNCMYPSNAFVNVLVRGGANTFYVSDDGGAVRELMTAGVEFSGLRSLLANELGYRGLQDKNGVIYSGAISKEALPLAISLVANASKEVAGILFDRAKIKRTRDFKYLLRQFVNQEFESKVRHDQLIVGGSNKPHKFDNVVDLQNGIRLIIDPVVHEPASINARVVANLDVRAANHPNLRQVIVYDDNEAWGPADINLLNVGAPSVVSFTNSKQALNRLAA